MKAAYLLAILILVPAAWSEQPAMFRGNHEHTGLYGAAGVPSFGKVKWRFSTHGPVVSSPTVAGDTLYVGSNDGRLYAINLADGSEKWKFRTKSRVASSPAVAGGLVFVESYDGNLYAVDAASGKMKWQFATAGERRFAAKHLHGAQPVTETMPDPFDFYLSSPAVAEGVVYFGSGDGYVYALDAASGSLKWKFQTGNVVHASPAVADGTVYIGSWDSYFYALDAATGKETWRFKTGEDKEIYNQVGIQSSAAVADGIVYFGCRDSNLYALDARTGEKKWAANNKGSWVIGSPAVSGGKVYFTTSDSGMFHAVDAKTGVEVFSSKFFWPMFSSPAIAGTTLYIGSHDGKLRAIDLQTQKIAWTFETGASQQNLATFTKPDGNVNYEAAFSSDFYDDIVVGVQKLMTVGAILASPAVAGSVVYVGSWDGNVYAIE